MSAESFYQQIESVNQTARPLEAWNPPLSGDMNCQIKRDGSWHIDGSPITNVKLIRLFSTVLKKEKDEYFLLTPVEKWRIQVEDLPFMVVELDIEHKNSKEQLIKARTNVGDRVTIDQSHPLSSSPIKALNNDQVIPILFIRAQLEARFNRTCFIELAEVLQPGADAEAYKVISAGTEFTLNL
ncbi:MAG: DUF1285 domain-containing protein [Gammaproteobacteria bacterium]|nr:DUF1285 domain-containing protein [Gammaproteobacteria bacterium]